MPKPDLIDRGALTYKADLFYQITESWKIIPWAAVRVCEINNATSVDAVPVVRCRECWRKQTVDCPMFLRGGDYAFHDGFCHLGERKEDDHVE